jgi:hypothetical protein
MKTILVPFLSNAARHLAQLAAGALATSGYINASQVEGGSAAILFGLTLAWSVAEKRGLLKAIGL